MTSERQRAANRLNARRSTGPRSIGGKKRAGRNAYRHGLSLSITSIGAFAKPLDDRARTIAGDSEDPTVLGHARAIAAAELDIAGARLAKIGLIERVRAFGAFDPPVLSGFLAELARLFRSRVARKPIDLAETMPSDEPDRSAEAVRRVLPELRRLDRYERRASARRDRAVQALLLSKTTKP